MSLNELSESELDQVQTVRLHGYDRAYLKVGSGPAVLLIHGIGSKHETWKPIIRELAKTHTVIAPDLLGHGRSAKPRADYSVGGFANGMRDLLTYLGIDKVTVVGHSLGGGVAAQFTYQFPQRTERLVLVSSGGLGPEVNPIIPLTTLPGGAAGLAAVAGVRPLRRVNARILARLTSTKIPYTADTEQLSIVLEDFKTRDARRAFRHVLRNIVDWRGQFVTMRDRAYLTEFVPIMVVWGKRDTVIPVRHAKIAGDLIPSARIEIFEKAGHFPHADEPERFTEVLNDFIATTTPGRYSHHHWSRTLKRGPLPNYETLPDQEEVIAVDFKQAGTT